MYSFNKYLRVILAVILLLLAAGSALSLAAEIPRTITAGKVTGNVGTTVAVPITIDNSTGVGGIAFTIKYDPAIFSFLGLEQVQPGWTINDPDKLSPAGFKVPVASVVNNVAYYNPYRAEAPYDTVQYTKAAPSTLFYQYNDMKDGLGNPVGLVFFAGASAEPLTGTSIFKANFQIKASTSIVNGSFFPVQLLRTIINNPAAGYAGDTFLPILLGTGEKVGGLYTSSIFPPIPALLVGGGITVGGVTVYSLGGKATYGATATGLPAAGCIVTLRKEITPGIYGFNDQTVVSATGQYNFSGKPAGTYKIFVGSLDPNFNNYESAAITLAADKPDANAELAAKPTPIRVSGQVTSGNIPGLFVRVVDTANNVMGIYGVGADGNWTSSLLPPGTYKWYLGYGSMTPAGPYDSAASVTFDTATLKTISGTIAGLPQNSGAVTAISEAGKIQKTIPVTNASYTISNLVPAADYIVSLAAPGTPVTYYNDKKDIAEATRVSVASANATAINFNITPPGRHITGWIKDTAAGVAGITVYGFEVNTFAMVQAATDASGNFDLTVDPGTYQVFVIKANGSIFYFFNENGTPTQSESSATLRIVSSVTIINTNIDISECNLTLTGRVTKGAAGEPVANALITAATATQRALAVTGQDGRYSVGGLCQGTIYGVDMKPLTGNYPVQSATIVAGTDTTKDFVIDTGAILSGTVTEANSNPVKNILGAMIYLKDSTTGALVGGRIYFSGTDGAYSILDIKEGTYALEVTHPDYRSYTTPDPGSFPMGSSNLTQNVALDKGAYFKGTVTEANSNPVKNLAGATVIATRVGAAPIYAVTNSDGAYSIYGVDAGQNYIIVAQKRGYERQAQTLKQPTTTGTVVDFALSLPATFYTVSGTVNTNASTSPQVSGAIVLVSSTSKNFFASTTTDANGAYSVGNLIASTDYKIVVIPPGLPTQESTFTVGPSATMNFTIALGKDIGGTVTGSNVAIPSATKIYVFLYKGTTYMGFRVAETNGAFLFKGLPDDGSGTDYKVLALAAGYTPKWYTAGADAGTSNATATAINITGGSKTDANIALIKP